MFAAASSHLPVPVDRAHVAVVDPKWQARWFPSLRRTDDHPLDTLGAGSLLSLDVRGGPAAVALRTRRVVRSTITAVGEAADGRSVTLRLSLSPWHGGTAVVLSVDADGPDRGWPARRLSRRLETSLAGLAAVASSSVTWPGAPGS
jgi:hypothetical protein